jgi:hypothetical protein
MVPLILPIPEVFDHTPRINPPSTLMFWPVM